MRRRSLRYFTLTSLLGELLLPSCSDGSNQVSTLALRGAEPAGQNCPSGGVRIDTGFDRNGNGQLDASEIDLTGYVCNGVDGATGPTGPTGALGNSDYDGTGHNSLVNVTPFDGTRGDCDEGGLEVETGLDDGGATDTADDGILGATEVDETQILCHGPSIAGATGAVGATGATGATGAAGASGAVGATGATGATEGATGATGAAGALPVGDDAIINGFFEIGTLFGWEASDFNQMLSNGSQMAGNFSPEFNFNPTHGVRSTFRQFVDFRHTQLTEPRLSFGIAMPPNPNLTTFSLGVRSIDVDTGGELDSIAVFDGFDFSTVVCQSGSCADFSVGATAHLPNSVGHLVILEISWQSDVADATGATLQLDNFLLDETP
jgi:hypothetical protein